MDGVAILFDASELAAVIALIDGLGDFRRAELLSSIGALGEDQTRRRISDEKTGPDGSAWPANAEGTSILHRTGQHLLQSISWMQSGDVVEWGAAWEFAHIHQFGAVILPKAAKRLSFLLGGRRVFARRVTIPARPFLGISEANAKEIEQLVSDFFGGLSQAVGMTP